MTKKEIFEVVKYFKNIYTTINFAEVVYFIDTSFYYLGEQHYILHGELFTKENNAFLEWLKKGGKLFMYMTQVRLLTECLKKNIISLDITDDSFSLKFKDKNDNPREFLCERLKEGDTFFDKVVDKTKMIRSKLSFKRDLPSNYFDGKELLEVYLKNGDIVDDRTSDKLIEIPVKRILSILKSNIHSIRFSNRLDNGRRYIEITGNNKFVRLHQIFATI